MIRLPDSIHSAQCAIPTQNKAKKGITEYIDIFCNQQGNSSATAICHPLLSCSDTMQINWSLHSLDSTLAKFRFGYVILPERLSGDLNGHDDAYQLDVRTYPTHTYSFIADFTPHDAGKLAAGLRERKSWSSHSTIRHWG